MTTTIYMNSKEIKTREKRKPVLFSLQTFQHHRHFLSVLTVIWVFMVGIGMSSLWKYQSTPAEVTESPRKWPIHSQIKHHPFRPTLLMFAHPRCPCTRASIGELSSLMTHCGDLVDARVLFFNPENGSNTWAKTDLWTSAEAIPGIKVSCDYQGQEAKIFHSTTSGYVLLYNAQGRLMFQGGITASRGHSGENAGRSAIESVLTNRRAKTKQTFVYGCPLQDRNDVSGKEAQLCRQ